MQRWTMWVAVAAAVGCGGTTATDLSSALPQAAGVAIGTPTASQPGKPKPRLKSGDHSDDYQLTYDLATNINGAVGWVLTLIDTVVQLPPTDCTANGCTWGPWSGALDPNSYQLVVQKQSDSPLTYSYVLQAEPKSRPQVGYLTIISGQSQPSATPHHGQGSFTIDFDTAQQLDQPHSDTGTLSATYDNTSLLTLNVTCKGCQDSQNPGQLNDSAYQYDDNATGGGTLQAAVRNLTSADTFSIESRWSANGAGRADLEGSTAFGQGTVSECWNPAFDAVYFTSTPMDPNNPPFGDPSLCGAFPTAQLATITAP